MPSQRHSFNFYVYVCACVVLSDIALRGQNRTAAALELELGCLEPPTGGVWELNLDPLQLQQALLTAKTFLPAPKTFLEVGPTTVY